MQSEINFVSVCEMGGRRGLLVLPFSSFLVGGKGLFGKVAPKW